MISSFNHSRELPLWGKAAALLGFLAVVSALLAPVAMLAEEARSGKLGGLCSAAFSPLFGAADNGAVDKEAADGSHCDLCSSLSFAIAPFAKSVLPSRSDQGTARNDLAFNLAAHIIGLPPSRGPPAS